MKVLITGANGQLGSALQARAPHGCGYVARSRSELDISNAAAVNAALETERVQVVINAAAYTDVEGAERSSDTAFRINRDAAATLAKSCASHHVRLVHVSTDFVFDGTKREPYSVDDEPRPLSIYGASKLQGEREVLSILQSNACVVRTSWLHSAQGANFVTKVLGRMKTGEPVRVVTDEIGSPTSAYSLAKALWSAANSAVHGVQHWSDEGVISRFEFASAIAEQAFDLGLLRTRAVLRPALVADFPSPTRRPAYSALDTRRTQAALGMQPRPWKQGLDLTLQDLRLAQGSADS
jgi:dTDP-4-dehydrorhamnose reductase